MREAKEGLQHDLPLQRDNAGPGLDQIRAGLSRPFVDNSVLPPFWLVTWAMAGFVDKVKAK